MAALLVITFMGGTAEGAPIIIDDFTSALNTIEITDTSVGVFVPGGSTTATDIGLLDVIGGTRELIVQTENTPGFIVGLDNLIVGVVPLAGFLDYNSTAGTDGQALLRYDGGGLGLNMSLEPAAGIRLVDLDLDLAAAACRVTVTLADGVGHHVSKTRTVFLPGLTSQLDFPFTDFPGVDPGNVFSVEVTIDPNAAGAGDLRLDRIETYGSGPGPAAVPAASPVTAAVMMGVLLLCMLYRLASGRHAHH